MTDGLLASDFSKNATTALIIFSMILISGGIRLVQELRAKNAAQQLDRLIHQRIRVRRGGVCMDIPAEELVVGDVVLLSAGDRVPADLRLTAVTDLFLSQAAITGESAVVEKSCRTLCYGSPRPVTQLENLAFMARARALWWQWAKIPSTAAFPRTTRRKSRPFRKALTPSHG